jgi:hypothetical protein
MLTQRSNKACSAQGMDVGLRPLRRVVEGIARIRRESAAPLPVPTLCEVSRGLGFIGRRCGRVVLVDVVIGYACANTTAKLTPKTERPPIIETSHRTSYSSSRSEFHIGALLCVRPALGRTLRRLHNDRSLCHTTRRVDDLAPLA